MGCSTADFLGCKRVKCVNISVTSSFDVLMTLWTGELLSPGAKTLSLNSKCHGVLGMSLIYFKIIVVCEQ